MMIAKNLNLQLCIVFLLFPKYDMPNDNNIVNPKEIINLSSFLNKKQHLPLVYSYHDKYQNFF